MPGVASKPYPDSESDPESYGTLTIPDLFTHTHEFGDATYGVTHTHGGPHRHAHAESGRYADPDRVTIADPKPDSYAIADTAPDSAAERY